MHKSKLAGFIIDCRDRIWIGAADFWGNALGMPVRDLPPGEGEIYKRLEDHQHGLHIEVQTVSHPSRVHLDIETDDIEAEVRRLEKLGAKRVKWFTAGGSWRPPRGSDFALCRQVRRSSTANSQRMGLSVVLSPIGNKFDIVQQILIKKR